MLISTRLPFDSNEPSRRIEKPEYRKIQCLFFSLLLWFSFLFFFFLAYVSSVCVVLLIFVFNNCHITSIDIIYFSRTFSFHVLCCCFFPGRVSVNCLAKYVQSRHRLKPASTVNTVVENNVVLAFQIKSLFWTNGGDRPKPLLASCLQHGCARERKYRNTIFILSSRSLFHTYCARATLYGTN